MYVNHYHEAIFIAHPRTASTATAHVLMQKGFEIIGDHHYVDHECIPRDYKVICTVRNPFDLMVSWYHNKPREQPFALWLPEFLDGCHYLQDRIFYGQPYATHVMHFEYLQEDFDQIAKQVGLPQTEIPPRNVSRERKVKGFPFIAYYDFRLARMMINRFLQDFTENGYPLPTLRTPCSAQF